MSFFVATTIRELRSMTALYDSYKKQLADLPKGSLQVKERNGKKYYYLVYRNDGKIVNDYAGNDEAIITELKEQLDRRKGIEKLLKGIKKEIALMNKVLEAAK
ncbi:MAG: hypothetical protein LBH09_06695 [Peptococcaceae bacterium]|jgi:hypothetical protein|nr:hypothetical protein [Peptococcaceae bacterium]